MQIDPEKLTPPPLVNSMCTECGALVPTNLPSCDMFLQTFLVDGPPERLLIDTFAMQHPKRACKSAKSYAAHFTGLGCAMEYAGSRHVYAAVGRWLNDSAGRIGLTRPQEPVERGRLTLRHLYGIDRGPAFDARLQEWAADVWAAYASQHEIARRWIEAAMKTR